MDDPEFGGLRSTNDIQHPVQKKLLWVRPTACPQGTIGPKILMDESHLDTMRVKICDNLTPGAWREARTRWAGMRLSNERLREFSSISEIPQLALVEQPSQLGVAHDTNRGNSHVVLT